jgi:hypothetical protein
VKRRLALVPLCLAAAGCVPRLPPEAPLRILHLDRAVAVRLVSDPAGLRVFAVAADGSPGPLLGSTPLDIDQLEVGKDIWKYSAPPPPAIPGPALLEDVSAGATRREPLGPRRLWTLLVESTGGAPPRRLDLALDPADLDRAFARRQVTFWIPAVAPSGPLRPEP